MLRTVQRIVLLGAGGVGKSAMVHQFIRGQIPARYTPTVEDLYQHFVDIPGYNSISVEILDTAGHHRFPAMRELAIKSGQAFVIVYAVDSRQSYEEAMTILNMIRDTKGRISSYVALVGNQKNTNECQRRVPRAEAERQAAELGCGFTETSATCLNDIRAIFAGLVQTACDQEVADMHRRTRRKSSLKERLLCVFSNTRSPRDLPAETDVPEINLERRSNWNMFLSLRKRRHSANNNFEKDPRNFSRILERK